MRISACKWQTHITHLFEQQGMGADGILFIYEETEAQRGASIKYSNFDNDGTFERT